MSELTKVDDVFVLHLGTDEDPEARLNPATLDRVGAALDEVEASTGPAALVTTGAAGGKFYSNGLDLGWLGSAGAAQAGDLVARVHGLLGRLLTFPVPTVAALTGHAFAAGAMVALAHDVRVMRADRGFFCLPEVDILIPFTPGMAALIQARVPRVTAHEAMTTGRRYGGHDALAGQLVDHAAEEIEVLPVATRLAQQMAGKNRATLAAIKEGMYGEVLATLRDGGLGPGGAALAGAGSG